jgi:deoxycytidine triphosphate deaminase
MAKLITGNRLLDAVKAQTFIENGLGTCAEGAKYDFRMGTQLLKTKFGPCDTSKLTEAERNQLYLEPGEVAFVLTEEALNLPENMMAVLSPKRKLSHDGILVMGGFFIDPCYRGNLLVGLYNFSTTKWPLRPGKKLIAVVFYELDGEELSTFPKPEPILDFPDDLVRMMQSYQPVMLQSLQELISSAQKDIADLRKEFRDQEDWKRTFRESLEKHDRQIDKLLAGLEEIGKRLDQEMSARQEGQQAFDHQLINLGGQVGELAKKGERRRTFWIATAAALLAGIVCAALSAYLTVRLATHMSNQPPTSTPSTMTPPAPKPPGHN